MRAERPPLTRTLRVVVGKAATGNSTRKCNRMAPLLRHGVGRGCRVAGWADSDFDDFVAVRWGPLVRFAYSLTGDEGLAQDLVQTALLSVYQASRRRAPDRPEAYVRRAIVNKFVSGKRRRRPREVLTETAPEPYVSHARWDAEQREVLSDLLEGLTDRQRAVLVLRYVEDWSDAQVADAMNLPVGTVKSLGSRGLKLLRTRLANTEEVGHDRG